MTKLHIKHALNASCSYSLCPLNYYHMLERRSSPLRKSFIKVEQFHLISLTNVACTQIRFPRAQFYNVEPWLCLSKSFENMAFNFDWICGNVFFFERGGCFFFFFFSFFFFLFCLFVLQSENFAYITRGSFIVFVKANHHWFCSREVCVD